MAKYVLQTYEFRAPFPGMRAAHCLPVGVFSSIDFRPLSECGAQAQSTTNAIMAVDDAAPNPTGSVQVATDLDETISAAHRLRLRNAFNAPNPLTSTRLGDVLHELFTLQGDIDQTRCCGPLLPTSQTLQFEIHLGGQVRRKPFDIGGPEWPLVQAQIRAMYRQLRADTLLGRLPSGFYRKALGYWLRKFKFKESDFARFVPDDLPREQPLDPATTLLETFNQSNSPVLGPVYTWNQLFNNSTVSTVFATDTQRCSVLDTVFGGNASCRAEADVSGTDHYAETDVVVMTSPGSNNNQWGPCTRFSISAQTHYMSRLVGIVNELRLSKVVTGTETDLATVGVTISIPDTVRQTSNGTSLSDSFNGVAKNSVTDSSITTGTRGGLWGYTTTTGESMGVPWTMSDIAASAGWGALMGMARNRLVVAN
jgi:hypothetical protein